MSQFTQVQDQRLLRVGKACNFACKFCNVSHNERNYSQLRSEEEIKEDVDETLKESIPEHTNITISGGEPSLFKKEVLFMLDEINKRGKYSIEIQTNASRIDRDFAQVLKDKGVTNALVSFHSIDKKSYEKLLVVDFDQEFPQVCEGIRNLVDAGIMVSPNIVVTSYNLSGLIETVQFLLKKFPELMLYNIGVFQPHGDGEKNQQELKVNYDEAAQSFNELADILVQNKKTPFFHFCSLPTCFFKEKNKKYFIEYRNHRYFRQQNVEKGSYLMSEINASEKRKYPACYFCYEKNFCSGVWKEYKNENIVPQYFSYKDF